LIQEDYDAAKPDCEMGEEPAALGKGLTGDDLPDAKGKYLGRMVLAEGDISPCKHQPVT